MSAGGGIADWVQSIEEVADAMPGNEGWRPGDAPSEASGPAPFHPLANLFPLIEGKAFDDLVEDIRANGLREPIKVLDGQIIDGRNRFRAGVAAGILKPLVPKPGSSPEFIKHFALFLPEYDGDPLAFVISRNLHRRHLTESQRALIAARLATMDVGRPKAEPPPGADAPPSPTRGEEEEPVAGPEIVPIGTISREKAGELLSVGERSVSRAREVLEHGAAELQRAVEAGSVSVAAAAEIAQKPVAEQARLLEALPRDDAGQLTAEARTTVRRLAGELRAENQAAKKLRRAERERELGARQTALPERKFGVIYADPEWRFEPYSRDSGMDRAADNHYPTSPTLDIITRPVGAIAAPDCVLFLWATAPMLPQALRVMEGWGFAYKTHVVWRKAELKLAGTVDPARLDRGLGSGSMSDVSDIDNLEAADNRNSGGRLVLGTGYWVRSAHELLLIGTRGDPVAPAMGTQFPSVVDHPPLRHSQKPDRFAELIEAYFPSLPKIELNRRGPARPGWEAWGNEASATPEVVGNEVESSPPPGADAPPSPTPTSGVPDVGRSKLAEVGNSRRSAGGEGEGAGATAPKAQPQPRLLGYARTAPIPPPEGETAGGGKPFTLAGLSEVERYEARTEQLVLRAAAETGRAPEGGTPVMQTIGLRRCAVAGWAFIMRDGSATITDAGRVRLAELDAAFAAEGAGRDLADTSSMEGAT